MKWAYIIWDWLKDGTAIWSGCFVVLLIHECGHAIGAKIARFPLIEIRLGTGPILFSFNTTSCSLTLHALPLGGWVRALPQGMRWLRVRNMILSGGGPAATALGCWLFSWAWFGKADSMDHTWWQLFTVVAFFMSGFLLLSTLLPYSSKLYGKMVESDGLQLLRIPFLSQQELLHPDVSLILSEICTFIKKGNFEKADRIFREALKNSPNDNFHCRLALANVLSEFEHIPEAIQIYRKLIADPELSPEYHRDVCDGFACVSIYYEQRDLLQEGKALVEKTLLNFPNAITLKGTLGGILFELGETEHAIVLLQEVCQSESLLDRGISNAYLALIAAQRHNEGAARKALAEISPEFASHRLINRLTKSTETLLIAEAHPNIPA